MRSLGRDARAGRSGGLGARAALCRTRRSWPRSAAEAARGGGQQGAARGREGDAGARRRNAAGGERLRPSGHRCLSSTAQDGQSAAAPTSSRAFRCGGGGQVTTARAAWDPAGAHARACRDGNRAAAGTVAPAVTAAPSGPYAWSRGGMAGGGGRAGRRGATRASRRPGSRWAHWRWIPGGSCGRIRDCQRS